MTTPCSLAAHLRAPHPPWPRDQHGVVAVTWGMSIHVQRRRSEGSWRRGRAIHSSSCASLASRSLFLANSTPLSACSPSCRTRRLTIGHRRRACSGWGRRGSLVVMTTRRPTASELEAAAGKAIPDVIAPGLDVLFCGINPGLWSAAVGHHFARPGNRFWKVLHAAGFTPDVVAPEDDRRLLELGLGITNLVPRSSATAAELSAEELRAGGRRLSLVRSAGSGRASSPSWAWAPSGRRSADPPPAWASSPSSSRGQGSGCSRTRAGSKPTTSSMISWLCLGICGRP